MPTNAISNPGNENYMVICFKNADRCLIAAQLCPRLGQPRAPVHMQSCQLKFAFVCCRFLFSFSLRTAPRSGPGANLQENEGTQGIREPARNFVFPLQNSSDCVDDRYRSMTFKLKKRRVSLFFKIKADMALAEKSSFPPIF